jgi:uncharacterized protein (DUF1810 family)
MQHSLLGKRLKECTALVLKVSGKTAHEIFGSPDDLKFRSCMTLFARVEMKLNGGNVFNDNIEKYFSGEYDRRTLEQLR